jgi:hypothetical protein
MLDAHPPLFSEVLLNHQTPEMLFLARKIVQAESNHIDRMISTILDPQPYSEQFGGMYGIDKHSELL